MSNLDNTVGFIGAGNMGMAILKGFTGLAKEKGINIIVSDIDEGKRQEVEALGHKFITSNAQLVRSSKYIAFLCKPQLLDSIMCECENEWRKDSVIVSFCAGISERFYTERVGNDAKVVILMPNTPMQIGLGATAYAYNKNVTPDEINLVKTIINSCGISEEIPMDKMKEIIAINGSSPAFLYYIAKGFIDNAAKNGIDSESALKLFSETMVGSAKMLVSGIQNGNDIDTLIAQVTSKGGTTSEGLKVMRENNLLDIVDKACDACTKRAYELDN